MNPTLKEITEKDVEKNSSFVCGFCNRHKINNLEWGTMYKLGSIQVHYFCLLFSAKLSQNGEDEEGILGFLPQDIKKEFTRGTKLKCTYCKQPRATVGCSVKSCKKSFHYTCGYENSCHFQFDGAYEGYCPSHKPKLHIPLLNQEDWVCPICFCPVHPDKGPICPPCCGKAVFHRKCVMKMATCHGYFFKCPLCNDKNKFEMAMKMSGVYVPQMDAAWERDPNAFADQIRQYSTCDAEECLCPDGRNHHVKETRWNLSRCGGCGASAIHKECGKLPTYSYKCSTCETVLAGTGLLSSQSSEESDTESRIASQSRTQSISRGARISRPDFYDDNDYKSTSEDDEPVDNVVEVIQSAPAIHELDEDVETPPPSCLQRLPTMHRLNHLVIDQKKNLVYDGLHHKKYKVVEDGRKVAITDSSRPSCSREGNVTAGGVRFRSSNERSNIPQICGNPDSAVIVAADINSLRDENLQEKLAQLKNQHLLATKNKANADQAQNCDIRLRDPEIPWQNAQSSLEFLAAPKIVRRKLDFEAKNASLPSIEKQTSLSLGTETVLSQVPIRLDLDDSPELTRNHWSPSSSCDPAKRSPVSNEKLKYNGNGSSRDSGIDSSHYQNVMIPAGNSVNKPTNDDVEVIDLDETVDDDDDIQICDIVPAQPIKILSVTSLNPQPFIPKSAAFMSMLSRFKEHQNGSYQSRPLNPVIGFSKENAFRRNPGAPIEEVTLSESDDDDLEILQESISPLKQQHDNNSNTLQGNTKMCVNAFSALTAGRSPTRGDWQPLDYSAKRPRLSPD